MVENSSHPNKQASAQGSNVPISTLTHTLEKEEIVQYSPRKTFEVTYDQLRTIQPITHHFSRALGLLHVANILPHKPVEKETTPSDVLISSMEDLVITTLEELVEPTKNQGELQPVEENPENEGEDFSFVERRILIITQI